MTALHLWPKYNNDLEKKTSFKMTISIQLTHIIIRDASKTRNMLQLQSVIGIVM